MKAMLLAAGRGKRMKSLTTNIPKPLLEVKGKCLIDWHLEKLSKAGFKDIVINVSYLSDKIIQHIGDGKRWNLNIIISHEPEALETAGGIRKAIFHLGYGPFVVINADIFSNYDYTNFKKIPLEETSLGHLVMVNNPAHNTNGDFGLSKNGTLMMNHDQLYTFSGIAVYKPQLFANLKEGIKIKLSEILESAINKKLIQGELFEGAWSDIGTPDRLDLINSSN